VSVAVESAGLRYVVRDDGIGVGAATAHGGPRAPAADPIGRGHGLAICTSLAARLGATLHIGSGDGGGTDAQLLLPRA
jgi:nitrate/nitrite-specific signal transduction histidine kinase